MTVIQALLLRPDEAASHACALELAAKRGSNLFALDGPDIQAIPDAFVAKIGPLDNWAVAIQQSWVFLLNIRKSRQGIGLALARCNLHNITAARLCRWHRGCLLRRCRRLIRCNARNCRFLNRRWRGNRRGLTGCCLLRRLRRYSRFRDRRGHWWCCGHLRFGRLRCGHCFWNCSRFRRCGRCRERHGDRAVGRRGHRAA